jgi:oxygen-dependent protoporphyrinogen oxidase
MSSVLIIGGGISGLATAYYLNKAGIPFILIEKSNHLGGVIRTENLSGCLVEGGPDSFLTAKPWALDLIRELGMDGQVIGSNDDRRETFIWKRGEMVPIPDGMQFMIPTKVGPMLSSGLVGWGTKIKMGLEFFRKPQSAPPHDRSVAEFVRDHFGQETIDYIAEPLLAGVYGGDVDQLSIRSVLPRFVELEGKYGSLSKAVIDRVEKAQPENGSKPPLFTTLRGGLGSLIDKLLDAVAENIQGIRGQAETVERTPAGFRVKIADEWIDGTEIVLACEAHQGAAVTKISFPRLSAALDSVPYSSSMTVALGFDIRDIPKIPQGFGFLVPRVERKRLVACTYVGNKFKDREAENMLLVRCFLGGYNDPGILDEPDEAVTRIVLDELRTYANITSKPVFTRIHRWPKSMAQYTVGHEERVAEIEAARQDIPGVYLAGNAYRGIGIPDCVRMAKEAAEAIVERHRQINKQ